MGEIQVQGGAENTLETDRAGSGDCVACSCGIFAAVCEYCSKCSPILCMRHAGGQFPQVSGDPMRHDDVNWKYEKRDRVFVQISADKG